MERLGWWLCAGLAKLGALDADDSDEAASCADASGLDPAAMLFGGMLRESRIAYPLAVDAWQAVGEHLFEDPEDGVSVRYVHGEERDRWIDVYFYPAGALDGALVAQAAAAEAELIRQAHRQAGHANFDLGGLRSFSFAGGDGRSVDANALDLAFTADGVRYSSAMTLWLDRLYFIKARYSIEESKLSRRDAREQLQQFVARLQPRVNIVNLGDGDASLPGQLAGLGCVDGRMQEVPQDIAPDGMRELLLQYERPQSPPMPGPGARTVELSVN